MRVFGLPSLLSAMLAGHRVFSARRPQLSKRREGATR
jgi:hypothetical protein